MVFVFMGFFSFRAGGVGVGWGCWGWWGDLDFF